MGRNILITGAASGLGKAFLETYAQDPSNTIYALDKEFPADRSVGRPGIVWIPCDITSTSAIDTYMKALLSEHLIHISGLDLVIHSVGVRGLVPSAEIKEYKDVAKAESLEIMTKGTMRRTFDVNTVGTLLLIQALVPFLRRTGGASNTDAAEQAPTKIIIMTSRLGSLTLNNPSNAAAGGAYAYRASKAALNATVRSLAVDIPEVIWLLLHPGRVETGLVSIKEDDAMDAGEVVREQLVGLVEGLRWKRGVRFVDRFGVDIAW